MKKSLPILLIFALLGVACARTPVEEVPPAGEVAPPVEEAAPPEVAAPPEAVERNLRVSFAWPLYIDPAVGSDYVGSTALANLYDALVFPNAAAGTDPWLATSWDVSPDGLTYTFTLREGAKFHDGSELLASDVVYSYERLQTVGEGYAYLVSGVSEITAPDDSTVVFTLERPSGLFVPSLIRLYILNEDLVRQNTLAEGPYGAEGDYGKNWLLTHDAGSGPYTIVDFPLEEFALMEKFDDWWNAEMFAENAPTSVKFIGTTEAATVRTLMETGELEITDQWQSVEAFQALDQIEGVDITSFPTMSSFYYMMNNRTPPLDDVHCRRAMSYAFDYQAAVGLEWPGTQVMDGPVPAVLGGHDPNVFTFTRDLDKAADELAQCAYAANIADYPVTVAWVTEVPGEEKFALLFQANMAEIGIPVEVQPTPWLSMVENTSSQETAPHIATIYVSAALPEAGLMLKDRYHSSTSGTWQQNEWLLDAELDAAIDDALATVDPAERFAKYGELEALIMELAPSLFLYDQREQHAVVDYIDWSPEANSAVMGYQFFLPLVGVNTN
ncbi:MAG TPA: ABC transporter substrate-binding protein [Anaerolineales bacterium]